MESTPTFLLTLGAVLLLGLVTSTLGRRTALPRVTLLLFFGALIGPEVLDLIPTFFEGQFELVANITLLMVGFLLGGKLTRQSLSHSANKILWISLGAAVLTALLVSVGLMWVGVPEKIAILLGCIASATAPTAIYDVVNESRFEGAFKNLLLAIVALDDVWALLLFGVGLALLAAPNGGGFELSLVLAVLLEIGGALLLGVILGAPAAYLTGRIKPGRPILTEALGLVLCCGGLALWLGVSFLIATMTMGAVIANSAQHHEHPFHAIEGIESPFMVVFFVLAGASLEFSAFVNLGLIGGVYLVCRTMGKILGAHLGARVSGADKLTRDWIGIAMLPQAGVPIGMALVAANYAPQYRELLLSVVISSTVFFEIVGPIFTRIALQKAQSNDRRDVD